MIIYSILEKVAEKNALKSQTRGGVTPNQTLISKKKLFQGPHRTILRHTKHVLHLVPLSNAFPCGMFGKRPGFLLHFFCNLPLYYMYIIFAMVVINPDHAVLELCDPVDFKDQKANARKSQE